MKFPATICLSVIAFLLLLQQAKAELRADFTMDKNGGCSPLVVSFTNTTEGASANAKWQWDFGNGNTSTLKNPAAVFSNETTCNVTLTVTDGTQTSIKTKTITVYKKPIIDFTITPDNGCMPLTTSMTGIVSGGDGAISLWNWDFGDGSIQSSAVPVVDHLYTFRQTASVSVTAISNYGCSGAKRKENSVVVKDSIHVSFSADKRTFCNPDATVLFSNTSTGAGSLTYAWDFGDGSSSPAASPTHTFTATGIYTVTLTVTSSEGCAVSKIENGYINVGSFVTDFNVPSITCENRSIQFMNTSMPHPTQSNWYVNGSAITATSDSALQYVFPSAGTYIIKLVNNFESCQQEITHQVEIRSNPRLDTFVVEHAGFCYPPYTINFRDTSSEAIRWRWNFYYYYGSATVYSTTQNTANVYSSDGYYNVHLEIDNAAGCTSSISKWINIERVSVSIIQTDTSGSDACGSITKKFKAQSNDPITSYSWQFGDGATSTDATPEHTYTLRGEYEATLTYTTAGGCSGTVTSSGIRVMQPPSGDFTIVPTVCGSNYVSPNLVYSGDFWWVRWDYGDGTGLGWDNGTHQYQSEGVYTITLVLYNGYCNDTITKNNIITVKGPFPRIDHIDYTCDGNRNVITITDSTTFNSKWTWDFGDGNSTTYTTYQPTLTHTYANSGNYIVKLTAQKDECILEKSMEVFILKKQKPVLSLDQAVTCINEPSPFHIRELEPNVFILSDPEPRYIFKKWEYFDGAPFIGSWTNNSWTWYTDLDGNLIVNEIKNDSIRMIMTSYFHNCDDTTNYAAIDVKGVVTQFDVLSDSVCFKSPVVLQDHSTASVGDTITSWTWNFGDGQQLTASHGGIVNHYYSSPGQYTVTLTASDAGGCTSSVTNSTRPVTVRGAKASFTVSPGTTTAPNNPVNFINNSITAFAGTVDWEWKFGDGAISTDQNPVHSYATAGNYTVQLIATDNGSGCRDTATIVINCAPEQTVFTTNTSFIGDQSACPPVRANFAFTSNIPYDSILWNFGDGVFLENQTHPSHIYTIPGEYIVTLDVYHQSVLTGTHRDTIFVSRPPAAIAADKISGCIGDTLKLYSPLPGNGYIYTWDFGNGAVMRGPDSAAVNIYSTAGIFSPSLVVQDVNGCASSIKLADNITIHPDPVISVLPVRAITCKDNGVQLQASGGTSYIWSPAAGLNNNSISNPIAIPPASTDYSLHAMDINGCKGSATITVTVPQPFSMQAISNADICKGGTVQLNVSGAVSYQWINNIGGLSNTGIRNPVASPAVTTMYSVVGYDQYPCYSDTIHVVVTVRPSPAVSLGNDLQVVIGVPQTLHSTGSADIIRWQWSPADYLSCTTCSAPLSTPYSSIEYVLKVYNQYNCEATDSIKITALCSGGSVAIPTAFTPNHDGDNDVFGIPGQGVRKVIFLKIFNRWGETVFEKKDFAPNDAAGSWNGKYKGMDAPAGAYVYFTELECSAGVRYRKQGTVMLIR